MADGKTAQLVSGWPSEGEPHLKISVGACHLQVAPGEELAWVSGTYEDPTGGLESRVVQEDGTVRVTQKSSLSKFKTPFSGAPNPGEMDKIDIDTGAVSLTMKNLANANFGEMSMNGGTASYEFDFGGELKRDAGVAQPESHVMARLKITRSGLAASLSVAAIASYASILRPRILRWGSSAAEAASAMPGDEIVGTPRYITNHAVTIHAPAALVWPWLVQIGQGRGGLYSYDWLENLLGFDIHSADRIIPEFQHLEPGDTIRLVREGYFADLRYEVIAVEKERALVLRTPGNPENNFAKNLPYESWTFALRKIDERTTRLIARTRSDFRPSVASYIWNKYGLEPAHSIMERRMLLGIKARAEASVGTGGGQRVPEAAIEAAESAA